MTFAEWLETKLNGVTQREAALMLGVSQAQVSRLLSGKSMPNATMVARLANRYQSEQDFLLGLFLPENETDQTIAMRLAEQEQGEVEG